MRTIYDQCIRTALTHVIPEQLSHWPPTYEMALSQARDLRSHLHFSSLEVPSERLVEFSTRLREELDAYPEYRDSFFYHEWRGMKGGTAHDGVIGAQANTAFNTITADLNLDQIDPDDWHVDVAVELYSPGKVLQWKKENHMFLVQHLIPNITNPVLTRLMQSSRWKTDTSAMLYSLAGFRTPISSTSSNEGIKYLNVYTTDKQPTYQLHQGAFRRHKPSDILPASLRHLLKDIHSIIDMFGGCREHTQEGCARMELRIPMIHAREKLRDVPEDLLMESVVIFDAEEWW
jgi:hypothetical protein